MNIQIILLLSILLVLIGFFVILLLVFLTYRKNKNRELDIREYEINSNISIDSSIVDKLDELIGNCLEDYNILHIPPTNNYDYINDEKEEEIRNGISDMVSKRISPIFLQQLSSYYNIENIDEIIATKIYSIVTLYVIEKNKMTEDEVNYNLPDYTDIRKSNNGKIYTKDIMF